MARRYNTDERRLWNGKTPEQFSPEETRQFMADTAAMLQKKEHFSMSDEKQATGQGPEQDTGGAGLPPGMTITARPIEPRGNLIGFASVKIGPITIDDFKILEGGKDGRFVGMPSKPDKSSDTGYRPTVWIDKESKADFNKIVLAQYDKAAEQKRGRADSQRSGPEKEGIAAQMEAAQKQADRDNAARPAPAKAGKAKAAER